MTLINYTPVEFTEAQKFAAGLTKHAQQFADDLVLKYRNNFAMLWYRDGWDIAKVQAVADEMGVGFTQMMQLNGAVGAFLNTYYPGQVPASELSSPVSYTVNPDGTMTFDAQGQYPGPQSE